MLNIACKKYCICPCCRWNHMELFSVPFLCYPHSLDMFIGHQQLIVHGNVIIMMAVSSFCWLIVGVDDFYQINLTSSRRMQYLHGGLWNICQGLVKSDDDIERSWCCEITTVISLWDMVELKNNILVLSYQEYCIYFFLTSD